MEAEYLNEEGLLPQATEELTGFAQQFNMAYSGQLESRHTQAVTMDENDRMVMFTQRWMSKMDDVTLPDPIELGGEDIVIGDNLKKDENIHAEMLAISWYLQGKHGKPQSMGVSQLVCARCSVVLKYFNIALHRWPPDENCLSAASRQRYPPKALQGKIPEKVKNNKEYPYDDTDWR